MKRGQVWVETVIYTLIGLALIGLVLAIVTPKINEFKDRAVIDQTIDALRLMDSKISEIIQEDSGNIRNVEFGMKRGALYFDSSSDVIYFELNDSKTIYSEPNVETSLGRIKILTSEGRVRNSIKLTLGYESDLRFIEQDETENLGVKKITAAAVPYKLSFKHAGFTQDQESREIIEIREIGG